MGAALTLADEREPIGKLRWSRLCGGPGKDMNKFGATTNSNRSLAHRRHGALHSTPVARCMLHNVCMTLYPTRLAPATRPQVHRFGLGLTLVDSLDTLWLMDLKPEFARAKDWVATKLNMCANRIESAATASGFQRESDPEAVTPVACVLFASAATTTSTSTCSSARFAC